MSSIAGRWSGHARTALSAALVVMLLAGLLAGSAPPTVPASSKPSFTPPVLAGASERVAERTAMVEHQIVAPRDGRRRVTAPRVLAAMQSVPRHAFVPANMRSRAYDDTPLPIGHGQTISQPYIVAFMTEVLDVEPGDRVLEIGTGSGYQAAVLSQLTDAVYTVEIIDPLAKRSTRALREQGADNVRTRHADGYHGWAEHGPYDAIIVTAAAGHLPPPLWDQLRPGGRIVIPIGGAYEVQRLVVIEKTKDGKRRSRTLMSVRFVPFTRAAEE